MAEMSFRRAIIIVSIFIWCIHVNGETPRQVNCEIYVYHPKCRGMQAKKRFMDSGDAKMDPACPCRNSKKARDFDIDIDPLTNSKLLEAMLAKGFDVDTIYDAYAATADRRRNYNVNRDRSSRRSKSLSESSTDFLLNSDTDEDYE